MKIKTANILYNEHQTPTSSDFDDVYFSNENGVEETDYVFLHGNALWQKWLQHSSTHFCIIETGFGTGLNFFRTLQWFYLFRYQNPQHVLTRLHFISTEKYPLGKDDLIKIFDKWQQNAFFDALESPDAKCASLLDTINAHSVNNEEQRRWVNQIMPQAMASWLKQYPNAIEGVHRRHFSAFDTPAVSKVEITLDLHYGDAIQSFEQIKSNKIGMAHAWFLDGFAPSKNNRMWQPGLFTQMARLSRKHASFATFTAAGFVKRGLTEVGFSVSKRKGFGRKREMLVGMYAHTHLRTERVDSRLDSASDTQAHVMPIARPSALQAPYFGRNCHANYAASEQDASETVRQAIASGLPSSPLIEVTIVGNGLAGAITALKMVEQGIQVRLLWQGKHPADGASGNPIGGFYPQLNAQNNTASQIQLHSFLYACQFYCALNHQMPFEHDWCGALQLGFNTNTQQRLAKFADKSLWPADIASIVNPEQASEIANIPIPYNALYMPKAGIISVPSVVAACIKLAEKSGLLTLQANTILHQYETCKNHVKLSIGKYANPECVADNAKRDGRAASTINTSALVIAMGDGAKSLVNSVIPLRLTRGQVEMVRSTGTIGQLNSLLCHKGYLTPAMQGFHALGSSYVKNDSACDVRENETTSNFDMHCQSMQDASWQNELNTARSQAGNSARAAIRCSTPDHLPVVGALPSELQFMELAHLYKALPLHHYPQGSDQENVFILTGLGSRGLTTAPLMAELLVSQILGQPLPLSDNLLNALNPNRFIVRALTRRQPL